MEHNIDISHYTSAVTQLVEQGCVEQAVELESKMMAKGLYAGSVKTELELDKFITVDNDMLELKRHVRTLVPLNDSILICGETGTGKEIIAKALHGSRGPHKPDGTNIEIGRFVSINCPALSVDLMFSELFGHIKGAFTGAIEDKIGKLQYAYKGTLFIDEVGDMPFAMQSALLRVLQERKIIKVGDNKEIDVDFRLVCATNKDLNDMVKHDSFREDLYYRISTFELYTKPLRDRLDDIELIAKHLSGKKHFPIEQLSEQKLKGNVRELERLVKRYCVLGSIK